MTCIERWKQMYPNGTKQFKHAHEVIKNECPNSYGIMFNPPECGDCVECWNRDIKTDESLKKDFGFDRATALMVLKELSRDMYPDYDIFGKGTLVIDRDKFEAIRKKFLDAGRPE